MIVLRTTLTCVLRRAWRSFSCVPPCIGFAEEGVGYQLLFHGGIREGVRQGRTDVRRTRHHVRQGAGDP